MCILARLVHLGELCDLADRYGPALIPQREAPEGSQVLEE